MSTSSRSSPTVTGTLHHVALGFESGADLATFDVPAAAGPAGVCCVRPGESNWARVLSTVSAPDAGPAMAILRPTELGPMNG